MRDRTESIIDPYLADGPELAPGTTPPVQFQALRDHLEDSPAAHGCIAVDPDRDQLLVECRERFDVQLAHDMDYNLQSLYRRAAQLDRVRATLSDTCIRQLLIELERNRLLLHAHDPWEGAAEELLCWRATRQFYSDALALAKRLLQHQQRRRLRQRPARRLRRIHVGRGAAAYTHVQALANTLNDGAPEVVGRYPLALQRLAAPPLRSLPRGTDSGAAATAPRAHGRVAYPQVRAAPGRRGAVEVQVRGARQLLENDELFDPTTGLTRHNVILILNHRHVALDLAILDTALRGLKSAVWLGPLLHPVSARDPHIVGLRAEGHGYPQALLQAAHNILATRRRCLAVFADGLTPSLLYGQQMRVRPGIRLLLDYVQRHNAASRRHTFIAAVTIDDSAFVLKGRDAGVTVTFHRALRAEDIAAPPAQPLVADINRGDPLLNHLECLFWSHGGLVRHGWRTPRVLETTARSCDESAGIRGTLRQHLHASLSDLARDWAALEG